MPCQHQTQMGLAVYLVGLHSQLLQFLLHCCYRLVNVFVGFTALDFEKIEQQAEGIFGGR